MEFYELIIIVFAWVIGTGSPGPATLAISATAMDHGRKAGLTIASGVVAGSASWGIAAALGISSLMIANAWLFEIIRYFGAAYLLYLSIKSLRNAFGKPKKMTIPAQKKSLFAKGMLLHLTNPKAILGWGSVYAIALPASASPVLVSKLFIILITASTVVFIGYGFLFSMEKVSRFYASLKRWFDLAFGLLFGTASIRLLTSKIEI